MEDPNVSELISINCIKDQLTMQDDPAAWRVILAVIGEEFLERYRSEGAEKESWFLRMGACSHWVRPTRAAGSRRVDLRCHRFKGASGWSHGLPEFDWSVILSFDGEGWKRVDKFSSKKQVVLRVAVPARTARHKQAAVHTVWSTSGQLTLYGFRNVDGRWLCVAASDERKQRTDPWLK